MTSCLTRWRPCMLVVLAAIMLGGAAPAGGPPPGPDQQLDPEAYKPRWQVGDQWVVETASLQRQVADEQAARQRGRPIQWQFTVQATEKLDGRDCFRLEIRPLLPGEGHPLTTLWVDSQSLALRQFQTQLRAADGLRTVTESYQFSGGQPAPVLTPLSVLPLDMPLFLGRQAKGPEKFQYEAAIGPPGQKAVGDIRFSFGVEQTFSRPAAEHVKGLLNDDFAKDLQSRPAVEVELKTPGRRVRQLWQQGRPWPAYADNGTTVSRLLKVTPAKPPAERPTEVRP